MRRTRPHGEERVAAEVDVAWTARQREVLALLAAGKTNPEIGHALGVSLDGAKWHVSEVMSKLGVHSREAAGEYWRQHQSWPARLRRGTGVFVSMGLGKAALAAGAMLVTGGIAAAVLLPSRDGERPTQPEATVTVDSAAEPTAPPSPTVAPPPVVAQQPDPNTEPIERRGLHPPGTRTGDARFDAVIELVERREVDGLLALVAWEGYPCSESQRPSGITLRCPAGVSDGTLLPAFPVGHIEGGPLDDETKIRDWLMQVVGRAGRLYGVLRPKSNPARATIIFASSPSDGAAPSINLTDDGRLAGAFLEPLSFGSYAYFLNSGGFYFAPPPLVFDAGLGVHKPGTRTGDAQVDTILDLVERQDILGLYGSISWQELACSRSDPPVPGTPNCDKIGVSGSTYPAFPIKSGGNTSWATTRSAVLSDLANAAGQSPFLVGVYRIRENGQDLRHIHFGVSDVGDAAGPTFTIDARGKLVLLTWEDELYPLDKSGVDWVFPPPR